MSIFDTKKSSAPRMRLLLGLLAALLGSGIAHAAPESASTLLGVWNGDRYDVAASGEVSRRLQKLCGEQSRGVASGSSEKGCTDKDCMSRLVSEQRGDRLVSATVRETDRENQNYLLRLSLWDAATQQYSEEQLLCDRCPLDTRYEQLAITAARMLESLPPPPPPPREPPSAPPAKPDSGPGLGPDTKAPPVLPVPPPPVVPNGDKGDKGEKKKLPLILDRPGLPLDATTRKVALGSLWTVTVTTALAAGGLGLANEYYIVTTDKGLLKHTLVGPASLMVAIAGLSLTTSSIATHFLRRSGRAPAVKAN